MVARIEETDLSVPVRKGPWLYYSRTVEGSSYGIHCRRPRPADAVPERRPTSRSCSTRTCLAEGHDYFSLGNFSVSPDHRWLAYAVDTTGDERYTLRFRDLGHGRRPTGRVDRGHLLRRGLGQRQRHRLLRPGRRGHAALPAVAPPGRDRPRPPTCWSIEEPDDHFYLGVGRTKDDRFVLCGLDSKITSEVRVARRRRPGRRLHGRRAPPPGHRVRASTTTGATRPAAVRAASSSSPTTGPRTSG